MRDSSAGADAEGCARGQVHCVCPAAPTIHHVIAALAGWLHAALPYLLLAGGLIASCTSQADNHTLLTHGCCIQSLNSISD